MDVWSTVDYKKQEAAWWRLAMRVRTRTCDKKRNSLTDCIETVKRQFVGSKMAFRCKTSTTPSRKSSLHLPSPV